MNCEILDTLGVAAPAKETTQCVAMIAQGITQLLKTGNLLKCGTLNFIPSLFLIFHPFQNITFSIFAKLF